jgi:uncharacterized protein YhfF
MLVRKKTATCWSAAEGDKGTQVGKQWVVLDSLKRPRGVLKTIQLTQRRFGEVESTFAFEEGEGDRLLDSWREAHGKSFRRNGGIEPETLLYCERFRLIETLKVKS